MNENHVRIIAAVVDTEKLTMYKEDGSTVVIMQGDQRLQRILDAHLNTWAANKVATVDISEENSYSAVEEKSNGFVKFFKVAKDKLKKFFSDAEAPAVKPVKAGKVPEMHVQVTRKPVEQPTVAEGVENKPAEVVYDNRAIPPAPTQMQSAVSEIMKHAEPVSNPKFEEPKEGGDHTMIAVVDDKIIPHVENLKPQFAAASGVLGSTKGVEAFLARLAKVIDKRRHSVEDLMKFMQRGDLPIADDGCIVIYKILQRADGGYVDCHTKNVPQKVGSLVHMDESLVDPDRRNDCSNGLHVARRQYLGNFSGDVCVIAKVKPEDVIAVPQYDSNKMRVCAYHILHELPSSAFQMLKTNKPMTGDVAMQKLLGDVLAGKHIGVTEKVKIGGNRGTNISITPISAQAKVKAPAEPARRVEAISEKSEGAPVVDVKAVAAAVVETKAMSSREKQAQELYEQFLSQPSLTDKQVTAQRLVDFKKTSKVSWTKLGLDDEIGLALTTIVKNAEAKVIPVETFENVPAPKAIKKPAKAKDNTIKLASVSSRQEHMLSLRELVKQDDTEAAKQLRDLKKAAKKGWQALGLPSDTGELIEKLLK